MVAVGHGNAMVCSADREVFERLCPRDWVSDDMKKQLVTPHPPPPPRIPPTLFEYHVALISPSFLEQVSFFNHRRILEMRAADAIRTKAEKAGKKLPAEFKVVKDESLEQYLKAGPADGKT